MDRAKIVDYYLEKIQDKDFTILNVRQELEKNNINEEEIKIIVRLVDSELQRQLTKKTTDSKSKELIWFGGVVTLSGLLITVGTYLGIIEMGIIIAPGVLLLYSLL